MSLEVGSIVEGVVTGVTGFGAFVQLPDNIVGMVHISEISNDFVRDIKEHIKIGDSVRVKVIGQEGGKVSLSIKKAQQDTGAVGNSAWKPQSKKDSALFEDMLSKFMKESEEKLTDIKRNIKNKRGGYTRNR